MPKLSGFMLKAGSKMEMKDKSSKKLELFLKCYIEKKFKSCTFTTTDAKSLETFFQETISGKYTSLIRNGLLLSISSFILETIL